jgi:excisionase family DNA binding protein
MPMEWLSLSDVAQILGIHPSTVRSWSDQGVLPVHRTQGGHRRYLRNEVDLWVLSQRSDPNSDANLVIQSAMRNTRFQISEGRLAAEAWYAKLDEDAREQYRISGRALLQGLIQAMSSSDEQAIAEAGLRIRFARPPLWPEQRRGHPRPALLSQRADRVDAVGVRIRRRSLAACLEQHVPQD